MPPLREQQFSSHITQLTKQDWRNSLVDAFIFYKWNQNSGPLGSILGLDILPALPAVKFNLPPLLNSFHTSSGQEIEGKPKQNTNSILFKKRHRNFPTTDNIFYLLQNFNQRDFLFKLTKTFFSTARTGGGGCRPRDLWRRKSPLRRYWRWVGGLYSITLYKYAWRYIIFFSTKNTLLPYRFLPNQFFIYNLAAL